MLPLCMKLSTPSLWYLWKLLFVLHQQTFLLSFLFQENLPYCAKIGPGLRKNALLFMREVSGNVSFLGKRKEGGDWWKMAGLRHFRPGFKIRRQQCFSDERRRSILEEEDYVTPFARILFTGYFASIRWPVKIQLKTLFSDARRKSILTRNMKESIM